MYEQASGGSGPSSAAGSDVAFQSILFERPHPRVEAVGEPDFFADLNLDQVLASMTVGRDEYELTPFFHASLHHVTEVRYRHEVLRDLEKTDVLRTVRRFGAAMRRMREHLAKVDKLHYQLQKQSWFLDAVEIYCDAVRSFTGELGELELGSRGLRGLVDYLIEYAGSARFTSLVDSTKALKDALATVRYAIRTNGARVTVTRYEGEPDYGAEVEQTFAKFQHGAVDSYLVKLPDHTDMNHVEAQILDGVARLHPEVFEPRAEFCSKHRNYLDATIGRFDREVQFYLAYLELIGPLKAAGLPFCYPHVATRSKAIGAVDAFDVALANKLVSEGNQVVGNDFHLGGPERIFVVTGPNNGGKTTFARMVGQLHHLAGLGLPVPGRDARLFLPDRIFTHFEKQEDIETLHGKFDDELVRVHAILEQATPHSLIVMNESFNSTTLNDALFVGTEVMKILLELDCLGVYVTFVDEIAALSGATVSMVSQIAPHNPAERTFKVIRQPANGRAYAWAIAEKYGLTYQRLMERVGA